MAEWSIATVLKTAVLQGTWGSNPYLSADRNSKGKKNKNLQINDFVGFIFCPQRKTQKMTQFIFLGI
jgi:hypothetical protein